MHVLWQEVHDALYHDRLPAILAAVIGIMGMTLAAAGLFGVVPHGVNRRQRETGVCMALGARHVVATVLRRGILLAGWGAAFGAAAALASGRLISSMLHGVKPYDPVALTAGVAIALAMALAASLYPAWKATRVDPAVVLRAE